MQEFVRSENKDSQSSLQKKPLNLLGMAKKAGLLAIGSESVKMSVREGKVKLIALASDTSEGSARQLRYSAENYGTICVDTPYTKFEFGNVTGRGSPGTVGFLDLGLAAEFMKKLSALDEARYGEIARMFKTKAKARSANNQSAKRRSKI